MAPSWSARGRASRPRRATGRGTRTGGAPGPPPPRGGRRGGPPPAAAPGGGGWGGGRGGGGGGRRGWALGGRDGGVGEGGPAGHAPGPQGVNRPQPADGCFEPGCFEPARPELRPRGERGAALQAVMFPDD